MKKYVELSKIEISRLLEVVGKDEDFPRYQVARIREEKENLIIEATDGKRAIQILKKPTDNVKGLFPLSSENEIFPEPPAYPVNISRRVLKIVKNAFQRKSKYNNKYCRNHAIICDGEIRIGDPVVRISYSSEDVKFPNVGKIFKKRSEKPIYSIPLNSGLLPKKEEIRLNFQDRSDPIFVDTFNDVESISTSWLVMPLND